MSTVYDTAERIMNSFTQSAHTTNTWFHGMKNKTKEELQLDDVYKHITQVDSPRKVLFTRKGPPLKFNTGSAAEFRLRDKADPLACFFLVTMIGVWLTQHCMSGQFQIHVVNHLGIGFSFEYGDNLGDVLIAESTLTTNSNQRGEA